MFQVRKRRKGPEIQKKSKYTNNLKVTDTDVNIKDDETFNIRNHESCFKVEREKSS